MAELACFCYVSSVNDGVLVFKPYNRNAIRCMLAARPIKEKENDNYDSIVYGIAPKPKYKRRFYYAGNARGINYDTDMYTDVSNLIVSVLNSAKIQPQNEAVLESIVSVRHLENLVKRMNDNQDILHHDKRMLGLAVMIALNITTIAETTPTAEGGEIVYQDQYFTMWKLTYNDHKLMPIQDTEFIEYKITLNDTVPIPQDASKYFASMLRYNYNRYTLITHGKGHYRLVRNNSLFNHAERVFATYRNIIKHNPNYKFENLDVNIVYPNWTAFVQAMIQGNKLDDCKRQLTQKVKFSRDVRVETAARQIDEISNVGTRQ
nr:NSP2 [Rotavirus A]